MKIDQIKQKISEDLKGIKNVNDLEDIRLKYLGRKGELTSVLRDLPSISQKERPIVGKMANELRKDLEIKLSSKKSEIEKKSAQLTIEQEWIDVTMPSAAQLRGHLHPISKVQREAEQIFRELGFMVVEGPEIEDEYYNFDALNIPEEHPARDMWDTFWLNDGRLLRTHTSPVQARFMQEHKSSLRIISAGKCYRHEATDASHETNFTQIEGLMLGEEINIANFKAILTYFFKRLFEKDVEIRLRPSYFPFVEPGFEVDMTCVKCEGKGCSICGKTGYIEVMGAGMVHPNVLGEADYPDSMQGFAFGLGLDRVAMLKYGIEDIRWFHSGDLRFLEQF